MPRGEQEEERTRNKQDDGGRSTNGDRLAAAANEDPKKDNKKKAIESIEEQAGQDRKDCDKGRRGGHPDTGAAWHCGQLLFLGKNPENPARRGQQEDKERTSASGVASWLSYWCLSALWRRLACCHAYTLTGCVAMLWSCGFRACRLALSH